MQRQHCSKSFDSPFSAAIANLLKCSMLLKSEWLMGNPRASHIRKRTRPRVSGTPNHVSFSARGLGYSLSFKVRRNEVTYINIKMTIQSL